VALSTAVNEEDAAGGGGGGGRAFDAAGVGLAAALDGAAAATLVLREVPQLRACAAWAALVHAAVTSASLTVLGLDFILTAMMFSL
jgi:hypothetical protein